MGCDTLFGLDAAFLLRAALSNNDSWHLLGLSSGSRFTPKLSDPFRLFRYGQELENPFGVAAGPHSQLAQNIVSAWLVGARYIELKTVQVLDTIAVTKPCMDMLDEGYNCEWSQELTLDAAYEEYLKAYVLLHVLRHALGHPAAENGPGFLFNMSAGYSLEGICSAPMQRFFARMLDAEHDIARLKKEWAPLYEAIDDIYINPCISNNLTLSTMHGCPAEEIEQIARYFLEELGVHTTLKLNPTLLGAERLREILHGKLGYPVKAMEVPDQAFEHDLSFAKAVELIKTLQAVAQGVGRDFHVKLTNTLEVKNHGVLPAKESHVYLSGRPLYPLSLSLAKELQEAFAGHLDLSYCGGLNALNAVPTLACGLAPLTVCSDLLRPGGYGKLAQYIRLARESMASHWVKRLPDFAKIVAGKPDLPSALVANLSTEVEKVCTPDGEYGYARSLNFPHRARKPKRSLPRFDCAAAACQMACPLGLELPEYLGHYAHGEGSSARLALLDANPLHHTQALYCESLCKHKCEHHCVRKCMDEAVHIQAVRALVQAESAHEAEPAYTPHPEAVIFGAGLPGLVCAALLHRAGVTVEVVDFGTGAGPELGALALGFQADRDALAHQGVLFSRLTSTWPGIIPTNVASYTQIYLTADAIDLEQEPEQKLGLGQSWEYLDMELDPAAHVAEERALTTQSAYEKLSTEENLELNLRDAMNDILSDVRQYNGNKERPERERTSYHACVSDSTTIHGRTFTRGPASLRDALCEGKNAAHTILTNLIKGQPLAPPRPALPLPQAATKFWYNSAPHFIRTAGKAREEAERCLQCDLDCGVCVTLCPNRALQRFCLPRKAGKVIETVPVFHVSPDGQGQFQYRPLPDLRLSQPVQVFHLADACNECGNCAPFCPSSGKPFIDKTHIHLSRASYDQALADMERLFAQDEGQNAIHSTAAENLAEQKRRHAAGHYLVFKDGLEYASPMGQASLEVAGSTFVYTDSQADAVYQQDEEHSFNLVRAAMHSTSFIDPDTGLIDEIRYRAGVALDQVAELILVYLTLSPLRDVLEGQPCTQ